MFKSYTCNATEVTLSPAAKNSVTLCKLSTGHSSLVYTTQVNGAFRAC